MKRTLRRIFYELKGQFYYFKYRDAIGLNWKEYNRLKKYNKNYQANFKSIFYGKPISFTSPFWFLHSIGEIFIDQVYKFPSNEESIKIIDCGANIGLSVLYFKKMHKKAKIIAIEADPNIYKQLRQNLHEYSYDNIELINAAVWNEETPLLFESQGSVGGKIANDEIQNTVQIPAVRLRNYLSSTVDFLKIDIEGAEYEVLKDCRDLLINVKNLFIEYHELQKEDQKLHEMLVWINKAGFKYYIKEAWNNMSYPFTKNYNDYYHMQLNIFCFRG